MTATRMLAAPWRREAAALLAIGAPMALTQVVQFFINTIDLLMIGRLGPEALAACSLGLVVYYVGFLAGFGPAMAISPIVSQALGRDAADVDDVRLSVRMGLWSLAFAFPPLLAFFLCSEWVMLGLGQPAAVAEAASSYVLALAPGLPFMLGVVLLRNFLAAIERTRAPLVIIVVVTALNALFNYLLIFGQWGAPRLELVGAGLASSLSHMIGFGLIVLYIRREAAARRFELFRDALKPHWGRLREVVALGWPIGITVAFEAMLFNASVLLMGRIGVAEVAAHQIALNVASLAFMAPLGLSFAGGVRVGLKAGADDLPGVRLAAATSIGVCVAVMAVLAAPGLLAPAWLAGLYLSDAGAEAAAVRALAATFLPVAAGFALFDAVQVAAAQALRGLKDVRAPMVLTAISYWAVGFPVAAGLGLASPVGAIGVWIGLFVSLALAAVLLGGRLWLLTRSPRGGPAQALAA